MERRLLATGLAVAAILVGCASRPGPVVATGPDTKTPAVLPETPQTSAKDPTKSNVAISQEIVGVCGLQQTETYFAFDSAAVSGRAGAILRKLADCFTTGPLAGRAMRLVGHADPRGDEEYNLVLGGRRAESVRSTLANFGLTSERISTSSRGEMDATGTDEPSWVQDRRVDVLLGG